MLRPTRRNGMQQLHIQDTYILHRYIIPPKKAPIAINATGAFFFFRDEVMPSKLTKSPFLSDLMSWFLRRKGLTACQKVGKV